MKHNPLFRQTILLTQGKLFGIIGVIQLYSDIPLVNLLSSDAPYFILQFNCQTFSSDQRETFGNQLVKHCTASISTFFLLLLKLSRFLQLFLPFVCVGVMYSGEYYVCDVTLSVHPHRAS
jgi:hypothetical protein